jgi:superfamily I DNA/RNA helicase
MFYQSEFKGKEINILHTNYRNSREISEIANRLLKIKNTRFGSIDHESNYLVTTVSKLPGEAVFLEDKGNAAAELGKKTSRSVNYAVVVLRNEDKSEARTVFRTPLLFSVQESKGLEYENIIIYNIISDNAAEFKAISDGVSNSDLLKDELEYSRNRDKSDKSSEVYKFYINSLYVSITRAIRNVYLIEKNTNHPLCRLLGISEDFAGKTIKEEISSADDWK